MRPSPSKPSRTLPNDLGKWTQYLRDRHPTVPAATADPLYALPSKLLDHIAGERALQGWLAPAERAFERDLSALCEPAGWCGLLEGVKIACNLLTSGLPLVETASAADLAKHAIAEERKQSWDVQARAYLGWLLTNSEFLRERDALRGSFRTKYPSCFHLMMAGQRRPQFRAFLDRWGISEMHGWGLPIPQGPNMTGLRWPDTLRGQRQSVHVEVPVTVSVQANYPLIANLAEMRRSATPTHLMEWGKILGRTGGTKGLIHFQHIFRLHFYRNLALGARYSDRFVGHIEALDRAFGRFLGISEGRVKRLRHDVAHRLCRR
jgi:hypothetical protein